MSLVTALIWCDWRCRRRIEKVEQFSGKRDLKSSLDLRLKDLVVYEVKFVLCTEYNFEVV